MHRQIKETPRALGIPLFEIITCGELTSSYQHQCGIAKQNKSTYIGTEKSKLLPMFFHLIFCSSHFIDLC